METFRHNPARPNSIENNRIVALAEWPERDELWIGTDGGMSRYNMRSGEFVPTGDHPDLNDNYISCFLKDGDAMWVGTTGGLFKVSVAGNDDIAVTQFPMFDGHSKVVPYIHAVERDGDGNIYVSNLGDLYMKGRHDSMFVKVWHFDWRIRQIYADMNGQVWIITNSEVYLFDPATATCRMPLAGCEPVGGGGANLCRMLSVTKNMYVLLSSRALYWITLSNDTYTMEQVCFDDDSFWRNNVMKSMMIDNALNIWITSAGDGVARFDLNAKSISHYGDVAESAKTYVQKIFVDSRKRIWIATFDDVRLIDSPGGIPVPVNGISEGVLDIYEDANGIWISSISHIYYIENGDLERMREIHQIPGFVNCGIAVRGPYAITGNGSDMVWVGMRNGILSVMLHDGAFAFGVSEIVSAQPMREFNNITSLLLSDDGTAGLSMFVSTKNMGLLQCKVSADGHLTNPKPVSQRFPECGNHIWTIVRVSSGKVYVGSDCGLRELTVGDDGQYVLVGVNGDDRLDTYKIMSVVEDGKGDLWLNTSQGLLAYDIHKGETSVLRSSDGLSSNILCEGAWYDADTNIMYVGNIKGMDMIDLNSLQSNNIQPPTQITGIRINSTPVYAGEEYDGRVVLHETPEYVEAIALKPNENNFSIDFASMHFSNPDKNTYVYKLEGFDDIWNTVDNNTHSATFTNVPPGHYVFKVKSMNCDGVAGVDERHLVIDIDTPLYRSWGAIMLYILLGMGGIYAVFRYYSHRQRMKREDLMRTMNHKAEMEIAEAKIQYNTNITHELRTPLSLIISPIDELLSKRYDDEFLDSRLRMIKSNADSLLQLISQFLDFRKVVNDKMVLKIRKERLSELLSEIVKSFAITAERKGIVLEFCDDLSFDTCWCDRDIIKKICSNLLANAIKYSPQGCHVMLHACISSDNEVQISVEDNGIGISQEDCGKIFDRFYQVAGTIGGTGIGLNLCKSLAEIHKGTISVVSHPGEGSIFTFEFPASKDVYTDHIVEDTPVAPAVEIPSDTSVRPEAVGASVRKVVLLIEDNVELRNYVAQILQADYKVMTAGNGQEGLAMTIDHVPDIVVCDIMMPIMDGIEYMRRVRQDIRTSHIPVILLTAKVAVESEIEGLSYGADDYIMKPFNPQVLKLRIENLLKLTSIKAQNAAKEAAGDSSEPVMNERERKFVDTLRQLVTDNMAVPGYGMDDICSAMGMSRMQLHRKITAILNQKPSQFIKEVKMKRAYSLLTEKGFNITETMYEVGYSNYSYFSKLFVEIHGISPREILGMRTRDESQH